MGRFEQPEQFELINEILQLAFEATPPEWRNLIINYYTDEEHSTISSSVLVDKDGSLIEADVETTSEMDELLERLQLHHAHSGRPKFSHCHIHVTLDGHYEADYSYDAIDWDALFLPDSNFFPTRRKMVKLD